MTDGHVSPCALVVSHEGAIAGLTATVGNLVKVTESLGNATEGISKTMMEMSRMDREENDISKRSIQELSRQMEERIGQWREILNKANDAMKQSAECIESLQRSTSHLGWLNTVLRFTSLHPKLEKFLFLFLIFAIVQYLWEHGPSMWRFFITLVRFTGWRFNL